MKKPTRLLLPLGILLAALTVAGAGQGKEGQNPAEHFPPHIQRVTWFGERADFSHDGKRVLFVEKTFGDIYEVELGTGIIRAMKRLTFSAYGYQGTDVCVVDLATRKVANLTNSPGEYDEPEGIFPDGQFTLVECDKQNKKGSSYVDLWKLRMDGGGYVERLTFFSDYPGYKSSNPVVSDDGRYMAFQMAKSKDPAGVGYGIFVYDFQKAKKQKR